MYNNLLLLKTISLSFIIFIVLAIYVVITIAQWKLFEKSGESGWKSLVPIYSSYIYITKIAREKSLYFWFIILSLLCVYRLCSFCTLPNINVSNFMIYLVYFVVFTNVILDFIVYSIVTISISENFGHGIGYSLGLIFLPFIFLMILAFGNSRFNPNNSNYYV